MKTNEIFDTEELKSQMEIPYLKQGKNIIKSFKDIGRNVKSPVEEFFWKLLYIYPELDFFNKRKIGDSIVIGNQSDVPYEEDGIKYYCQLGLFIESGDYILHLIIKDVNEKDPRKFFIKEAGCEKIEDTYKIIDWFIKTSRLLNCLPDKIDFKYRYN